ncbi:MAG: glycerol-3-phosphate dehydrogenase [Ruminococcaceae bacterium]|nr:glycerol-3-phosphate dehydrogenase [Oscillospiraceae bacterium]
MSIVTIIGAGMMGSALSYPLKDNGNEVRIVGTCLDDDIVTALISSRYHPKMKRYLPEGIKYYYYKDIQEAITGTEYIIGGVSSYGIEWFSENVLPIIPDEIPILSVTKGLVPEKDGELITIPEYYKRRLSVISPDKKLSLNAIGGPCTSYELCDRNQTYVAFCGEDIDILDRFKAIMQTAYYHIRTTTDVNGIECAVAMKNAYALAVSLAIGMGNKRDGKEAPEHYNSEAALFAQSVREMKRLIAYMNGGEDSLIFGAGDLYVTIFGGRTRKIGTLLGEGMSFSDAMDTLSGVTLESVSITRSCTKALMEASKHGKIDLDSFPLLMHVRSIIEDGAAPCPPWDDFH